jgi:septal ring factor EnvC (AmiA/AmiB activator)
MPQSVTHTQSKSSLKSRQSELKKIKAEIRRYEDRLKKSKKEEGNVLYRLDDYDRQTSLIRTLVSRLTEEIAANQRDIEIAKLNLSTAVNELKLLQKRYAKYVVRMYKRGRVHDTELLLSSKSVNQMYIRSKYLQAYSVQERESAEEIRTRKRTIERQKALLEEKLTRQRDIILEKKVEETRLKRKVSEQKNLLVKVRGNQESYEKQLKRKQEAARKIERIIADMIERARAEKLAEAQRLDPSIRALPSKPISETVFGKLKGRLPWPVSSGAVVGTYGNRLLSEEHQTVEVSKGIDIRVPNGAPVHCVADGTIGQIDYVVCFGDIVIIDHDNGFFTVYAGLTNIRVKEKQRVKAGTVIADCGESIEGSQVQFQIWRNRQHYNPLSWLSHR